MRLPFSVPNPDRATFDVVGMGENSVDLVAVVAAYPTPNDKQRVRRFVQLPGGQIATAMAVCSRLGWRTSYIGAFGDDLLGRVSKESLIAEGVDIGATWTVPGTPNQFALVVVDERSGSRTILWDRDPALAMERVALRDEAVTAGRLLVLDAQDTAAATAAARRARANGVVTIIDIEHGQPGTRELLGHIDAVIAAQSFPEEFTGYAQPGRALEALARELDAPFVCATLGEDGSLARCGGRELRTPAFPVACVDSTGAGDAFRGGFAAGCLLMPEGNIEDVLVYAHAVAALNCRGLGARGGMPTAEEVDQLLLARRAR